MAQATRTIYKGVTYTDKTATGLEILPVKEHGSLLTLPYRGNRSQKPFTSPHPNPLPKGEGVIVLCKLPDREASERLKGR
jgi:hypothetical protein